MTKSVRIENADLAPYKVRVRVFEKRPTEQNPDEAVQTEEKILSTPAQLETLTIWSGRYLIVDEAP